ncbi:uncharacterized protein TNCV_1698121 [Trichonephila clavipes]|nr:uncharacterized protein TNCV_1698121 [Trichonephila clavipes]
MSSTYRCKCASDDDQRAVKRNSSSDHHNWSRACAACNSESRIGELPWASPDTSSMIFKTQLEAGFVAKHYASPSQQDSNLIEPSITVIWLDSVQTDEAHFWLNGYVNKQNCRIWSEANPQVYVETPLHPEKLTGALYGLVESFFKNDEGHNVTVNGDRYRAMITNFFIPELNNHDVQELWFQQDGATCHTARATIDLLKDTFGDRLISRFGPLNWPPRSCDLTPLDYFLWGYVKSLVYADKPQTLDHLEDNIRRVIADIRPQMLEKVIENWTSRLDYIRASRGSPVPEIIFKM